MSLADFIIQISEARITAEKVKAAKETPCPQLDQPDQLKKEFR